MSVSSGNSVPWDLTVLGDGLLQVVSTDSGVTPTITDVPTSLHEVPVIRSGLKALDGVSLDVERGEFFALLGPNGAGKSTLIGIVCSLVNMDSGRVSVFGEDLFD